MIDEMMLNQEVVDKIVYIEHRIKKNTRALVILTIPLLIWAVFAVGILYSFYDTPHFKGEVDAQVIKVTTVKESHEVTYYETKVKLQRPDYEEVIEETYKLDTKYQVGDKIKVEYDSHEGIVIVTILIAMMGIGVMGFIMFFGAERKKYNNLIKILQDNKYISESESYKLFENIKQISRWHAGTLNGVEEFNAEATIDAQYIDADATIVDYSEKYKKKRAIYTKALCCVTLIIILCVWENLGLNSAEKKYTQKAIATVTNVEEIKKITYDITLHNTRHDVKDNITLVYDVNNKNYCVDKLVDRDMYNVNEQVEIYCNPNNPTWIYIQTEHEVTKFLDDIGLKISIIVELILIFKVYSSKRKMEEAQSS